MSVNSNVLKKLTNDQLLGYFNHNSKYTIEAINIAFSILKEERNYVFSTDELKKIDVLLKEKEKQNLERERIYNEEDALEDTIENKDFLKIESKKYILNIAGTLSVIAGGYLIYQNLKDLNLNTKSNKVKLTLSIIFSVVVILAALALYHFYGYEYILTYKREGFRPNSRRTALKCYFIIYVLLNFIFTNAIWNYFIPKDLKYRAKNDIYFK